MLGAEWPKILRGRQAALAALHCRNYVPVKMIVVVAPALFCVVSAMLALVNRPEVPAMLRYDCFDFHVSPFVRGYVGGDAAKHRLPFA